jgi:putative glutamine amidotransferase
LNEISGSVARGGIPLRSIIGICANYSADDRIGVDSGLGLPGQEWQLLADDYIKAIERAGGSPLILPITENMETLSRVLSVLDGILFTGGNDIDPRYYGEWPGPGLGVIDPRRDRHEIELAKTALYDMDIPVLGICRGCQLLNVASGGTLYQDLRLDRPEGLYHTQKYAPKYHPVHPVSIKPGSRLHAIFGQEELGVNSFNHQAIKRVGGGFEVTMTAPDGLVEGIEMPGERFVVAVQWHPEMMIDHDPGYLVLFKAFVEACARKWSVKR